MKPLNPFDLDLQKTTLIEASAGTGKTYTITTLAVRLVAAGYPIESILVVTFTEAAAAELKLRIRDRLSRVLGEMPHPEPPGGQEKTAENGPAGQTGRGPDDRDPNDPAGQVTGHVTGNPRKTTDELVDFLASQGDPEMICRRIRLALSCFDQASIMTIHAFCLQTLKAHAFETGTPFDMELMADASGFFRQVCMDFFMTTVNDLDPLVLKMLARKKMTPPALGRDMKPAVARPGIALIPPCPVFEDVSGQYREVTAQIREILGDGGREVADLIQADPGLDKRSYSKKNVPAWLGAACKALESDRENALFVMTEKGDSLYRFTRTCLAQKTKAGATPAGHLFFDLCEALYGLYRKMETNVISLKHQFPQFYGQSLSRLKQEQGQCFFDDLVNDLARALAGGPGSRQLVRAVQARYEACLIDEFQDTDPAQYTIFSTLFARAASRFGGFRPFFMIGDPKQAIYAFRGGDIFAYLAACKDSDQRFTLGKNYRSSPLLVQAVNDLFSAAPQPFVFDDIPFIRVGTPDTACHYLLDGDRLAAPLRFGFLPRKGLDLDRQRFLTKETARRLIPKLLAGQILADLEAPYTLMDKTHGAVPAGFGDMAVLVRTNQEAKEVQEALTQARIPSYLSKTGSVYDSPQAVELNDILWAVFSPGHVGFMKAALASPVFGFEPDRLKALSQKALWEWQDRFRGWKEIWETKGFIAMIMGLLHSQEGLLHPDSGLDERGLTNFYHLVELISQAALHRHLSMYYLLRWYQAQLFAGTRDEAADELRLESDRKAVAIVTIHKSKGLEYPIVYLPYLWSDPRPKDNGPVLFHDPDADFQLCLDLRGTDFQGEDTAGMDRATALHALETEAEQRRLLYVAVTRASAMCWIFWAGVSGVAASALGSMIHMDGCGEDADMISDLDALAGTGEKIQVQLLAPPGAVQPLTMDQALPADLSARAVTRQVRPGFSITSFSALAGHPGASETPDRSFLPEAPDTGDTMAPPDRTGTRIRLHAFPKGPGAGDFFHAVLEQIDFQWDLPAMTACVSNHLPRFGFSDPALAAPASAAIKEVVTTPLPAGTDRFRLTDISMGHRITETEFLFDVNRLDLTHPADLFDESGQWKAYAGNLRQQDPGRLAGFIKGFIDLVVRHREKYYIIDYKSNFLGDLYEDYALPALTRAMTHHHYVLQYHIYAVALHQYLGLRIKNYDRDKDFGGVLYLFIRGMHPDLPGSGVFFDRPMVCF
jgi:exodeoxyribonuclease V beta subunit